VTPTVPAPPRLDEIRAAVRAVCENSCVARVELFGSAARGANRPDSDVDLLVEFLPGSEIGLFEMGALKEDLEEWLGCRVDLVSRRAVERSRNPIRRAAILRNPIPVYAR
jgi:predicted nucleotidyltransferase